MLKRSGLVAELRTERDRAQRRVEQLNAALAALGGLGHSGARSPRSPASKRKPMSAAARQTNCCGSARTLGEMEEKQANQVKDTVVCTLVFNALRRLKGPRYLLVITLSF